MMEEIVRFDAETPALVESVVDGGEGERSIPRVRSVGCRPFVPMGGVVMHVLLTVDLNNLTDSKKREKFYAELEKKQWKKFRTTTTTWHAKFRDDVSAAGAVATSKKEVADAAQVAGIVSWDAVCLAGDDAPTIF